MTRVLSQATLVGLVVIVAGATSADASQRSDAFRKGPYLQNVSKKSVTIMWQSKVESAGTITIHSDPPRTITAEHDEIHEIVINGLEPDRRYRYTIECDGESAEGEFATAPQAGSPFTFVVFGDSRSNAGSHRRVVERIRKEVPDFLLGTGDMVDEGASRSDWQQFFDIERDLLRENVLFPSLGNHDRQGRGRTADNYRKFFSLPENSPNPERYYAVTYGNSRFLVLDSNAYSFALTDHTAWIEQELQAARQDKSIEHIFVSMHHPPFSVSLHGGNTELREAWTPLFERYQVDAVFSGHDHVYSHGERNGVHYFVSGGGGAPLYPRRKTARDIDKKTVKFFERTNHYVRVHVVGKFVEVSAIRDDGSLIETMSWGEAPVVGDEVDELLARGKTGAVGSGAAADGAPDGSMTSASGPADPQSRSRFGPLGLLGAGLAILAGLLLVGTLRR